MLDKTLQDGQYLVEDAMTNLKHVLCEARHKTPAREHDNMHPEQKSVLMVSCKQQKKEDVVLRPKAK